MSWSLPRIALLAAALASAVLLLAWEPSGADAKRKSCEPLVNFSGTKTRVVTLRGVTCAQAKRILRQYDKGLPEPPWSCALAHAPFKKLNGRIIGVSCGYGTGSSNLQKKSHAFVGTVKP